MFNRFKPFEGPASYTWKDPDTGYIYEEVTKKLLMERITAYRSQNNLEKIEHLSFVLECYWCSLPINYGKCEEVLDAPRGLFGYIKGGIVLAKNLWYKNFASQEVADARSLQCFTCKYNEFPKAQGFEAWSNSIAVASVGERQSLKHDDIGQCAVCTCQLKAKVFITGKIDIDPEHVSKFKEVDCWQLKNG